MHGAGLRSRHGYRADAGARPGSGPPATSAAGRPGSPGCSSSVGARYVADVSPSGGRHVYVLFAAPLPWRELRDAARALSERFPAIDPAPMSSLGGQISPRGARHKSGGWRVLFMPLSEARAAAERPNEAGVWNALLTEFAAERPADVRSAMAGAEPVAELDDAGVPWVPRLGGRARLGAELEQVARTGMWDRRPRAQRGPDGGALRRGGPGLAAGRCPRGDRLRCLERASPACTSGVPSPGGLERLLPAEWRKSITFVSGEKNVRDWHTSDLSPRPPAGEPATAAEYGRIRQWVTAIRLRGRGPGAGQGLGWARDRCPPGARSRSARRRWCRGSGVVEFGVRNLSLHSALSSRTVARVLELLSE